MDEIGAKHDQGPMDDHAAPTGSVQIPAPTAWPMVLALGISLMLAGMVTHWAISLLGLVMAVPAIVGWFFEVLPQEQHVYVDVHTDVIEMKSTRETLARLPLDERHRKLLPIETFSVMSGVKGGIAGGIAMIVPAALYGLIRYHSVWYAANLLAAGGFVSWAGESNAFLAKFHLRGLLAALAIHGLTSVLIGLLYGAMLPMYPKRPILTFGFIAPFLWTGILRSALGIISPILDQRIDWWWFIVSQIAFGLVAGFVVNLQVKVRTPQFRSLPFTVRAGIQILEEEKDKAP
jgi:Cytochrome c oxidase subunit IV